MILNRKSGRLERISRKTFSNMIILVKLILISMIIYDINWFGGLLLTRQTRTAPLLSSVAEDLSKATLIFAYFLQGVLQNILPE